MKELNIQDACDKLNKIMKAELAGVVRYTHSWSPALTVCPS
jgi:bacterioferritin (cytochrome b1)